MLKKFVSTKMTTVLKLLIAASIIAFMVGSGQLSFSKILHALNPLSFLWIASLCITTMALTSFRWNILLRIFNFRYTLWETLKLSLIGTFFNTFMPGAVGGDIIKTYYIYAEEKDKKSKILASFSVLLDRAVGLATLIFFSTLLFLFFWNDIADNVTFRKLFWFALSCSMLGASGIIVLWVLSKKNLNRVSTEQEKRFPKWLSSCFEIISHLKGKWHYIYVSLLMTFVTQSITISIFYFAARALGFYDIPLKTFFLAVPLGMLVMALPLTPAGVGTSQAAFLLMFQWIGVPSNFSGSDVRTVVQIIVVTTSLVSGFWFYIKYKRGSIKSDWNVMPETT